jgi:hypothetical protein
MAGDGRVSAEPVFKWDEADPDTITLDTLKAMTPEDLKLLDNAFGTTHDLSEHLRLQHDAGVL